MVSNTPMHHRLLYFAHKHLGKPYRYGARPVEVPRVFDCSSFVQYLYRRVGVKLPRTSIEQAKRGGTIWRRSNRTRTPTRTPLRVGDLLFFRGTEGRYDEAFPEGVGHVVMYTGEGQIVHASFARGKVVREPAAPWLRRADLVVIKRLLNPDPPR